MARDEDDDLYEEEFDFVDDEDDEDEEASDVDEDNRDDDSEQDESPGEEEDVDEYGRGKPAADYVVHIYEHQKFKRTIDRPFTAEDAEAFASEYNRASKSYGRLAVTGKNDAKPKKTIA